MALNLTKDQKKYLAVGAVAFVALSVVYWKFFWSPISQKIEDTGARIADLDSKIRTAKDKAAQLDRLEKELIVLNEQAIEAEKRLPKTKSVPEILVTVTKLAAKNGVMVTSFTPGALKSQQYFTELNYPMAASGQFHSIGRFLAGVALEERIFNVMNLVFNGSGAGVTITFTLVSYQYKG